MSNDEKQDARGRKRARSASSPSFDRKAGGRRCRQKEASDATVGQKLKSLESTVAMMNKGSLSGTTGGVHPPQGTLKGEKRVSSDEWAAISRVKVHGKNVCKLWNLSCGCKVSPCKFKHECWECGRPHTWYSRHFSR